ncbi:nucleoporin complex subunit 54-domain-containing protein [Daldinia vernicosa]|uniref:nucleoporin complex subunit 54-domain-containing protein n=1 Tax=Daldinia vernicosa TaxID=114800 RepID=UPI0020073282|nr:nucleoporin complex subunit 54-domain-containing protein [Daldinia vernicosa]KAI0845834.1 nucleoporin complex subunit 54-domain-containing protein [Daldinia vernicosa]
MSLFGSKPSGFGASTAPFGQSTTTTGFGQTANQSQTQNQPQSNTLGGGLLGGSTLGQPSTNAFGGSILGQPQAQQQQQPQQQLGASGFMNASQAPVQRSSLIWEPGRESLIHKPVTEQIEGMLEKWLPESPNTVFKYYFYNKVDQTRIPLYQPSPLEDPREWEQAVHDKPGPGYMPALATGFQAVSERLKMQRQVLGHFRQALHAINSSLDAILSQHDLQTSVRTANARRKHALLRRRCLALATKVQVLRNRGYSLDKEEDELKTKLETLDRAVTDPALSARTEELWSRLIMLRGYADSLQNEINKRGTEAQEGIGEEIEAQAKEILEKFDKQLQSLKTALEGVQKDYEEWSESNSLPKQ